MRNTIWVCGACGKTAATRYDFSDVSCAVNATECKPDSLQYDDHQRVVYADAVEPEEAE